MLRALHREPDWAPFDDGAARVHPSRERVRGECGGGGDPTRLMQVAAMDRWALRAAGGEPDWQDPLAARPAGPLPAFAGPRLQAAHS